MKEQLPSFDELPSVLSYDEVSEVFRRVMDIVETTNTYSCNTIEETLSDGIFSLEYNPQGCFDELIVHRIIRWINVNWACANDEFVEGAISIIVNVAPRKVAHRFLALKLQGEHRFTIQKELRETMDELDMDYHSS